MARHLFLFMVVMQMKVKKVWCSTLHLYFCFSLLLPLFLLFQSSYLPVETTTSVTVAAVVQKPALGVADVEVAVKVVEDFRSYIYAKCIAECTLHVFLVTFSCFRYSSLFYIQS
ncbi:hypothetical protein VNO80_25389 [Phaseolus coccineus]|uniref:Uncharacterized protein n=1 Tax=Phaseolus coccineus TaxID=3886 RepID=A0AAN9QNY9_PHACN